jgi:hypothetical protein
MEEGGRMNGGSGQERKERKRKEKCKKDLACITNFKDTEPHIKKVW